MILPEPYYQDDAVAIYNADCRPHLDALVGHCDLILTDPPYGVAERTQRRTNGRGNLAASNDFPEVHGDDAPFDPTPLLHAKQRLILFGANHYADKLPPSASWIVWDKLDGLTSKREVGFDDNADCELAWTNLGGPARLFPHRWKGMLKASERDDQRLHPTQKPVALMARLIAAYTEPGDLIRDPYMGSGPVLRAAKDLGRRAIGIEIDRSYCAAAAGRCAQDVLFGEAA